MDKIRGFLIKSIVLLINIGLVVGGVFFIKHRAEEGKSAVDSIQPSLADTALEVTSAAEELVPIAEIPVSNNNVVVDNNALPKIEPVIVLNTANPDPAVENTTPIVAPAPAVPKKTTKTS